MDQPGVQQLFFQHIKNNLPPHLSFVDEIAELLNISTDSAYRRIRGEKGISFDEIRMLCSHFKISLDQLFHLNSESIIFTGRSVDHSHFTFDLYMQNILKQLLLMNSFDRREMLYLNKDIPPFHYYNFREMAAFKFFFWMKTIVQYPLFGKSLFVADEFMEAQHTTGSKILQEYNKLPSQEIWNLENINSTISQIEYYRDTKVFASNQDVLRLYECLEKIIDHIEKQAEAGFKFPINGTPAQSKAGYKLFVNEFILGDNTVLAILNDTKIVYVNHSVLDIVWTKDTLFAEHTYQHFQNIIRKSMLISDVGERERSKFFNKMRERIQDCIKMVRE
jgi:hypothetical protein